VAVADDDRGGAALCVSGKAVEKNAGGDRSGVFGDCRRGGTGAGFRKDWADFQVFEAEESHFQTGKAGFILKNDLQDRLSNLDVLRGLAALAVCLFHFRRDMLGEIYNSAAKYGVYGVDIFFVISGFVIPLALWKSQFTYRKTISFWISRCARLYPAFFFASFIGFGLWYGSTLIPGFLGLPPPPVTIEKILSNLFLISDFSGQEWFLLVAWSLAIEAQYYVIIALVFPFLINARYFIRVIALFLWFLSPLVFGSFFLVFYWNALFGIGLAVMLYQQKMFDFKALNLFLLVGCVIQWETRGQVSAMVGLGTGLFILFMPPVRAKLLVWMGGISYSLYLLHAPIGGRVMNFFERYPDSPAALIISLPLALVVSVVAAYVFFRLVEWPSHKLSRVLRDKFQ